MPSKSLSLWLIGVVLFLTILGCSLTGLSQQDQAEVAIQTLSNQMTQDALSQPAASNTPALTDTPTPEPSITPTPTIAHVVFPGEPQVSIGALEDVVSANGAEQAIPGDDFSNNLFERPFASQSMDYAAYLDVTKAELSYAAPWYYVIIYLGGELPDESQASYMLELDQDMDGRGDWLILARAPSSQAWSTDGVQIWGDSNEDVGGPQPVLADTPDAARNGYDQLVFDQGVAADPDLAWARRDPQYPSRLQIVFKPDFASGMTAFTWGVYADAGVGQPGWLDYNDHFSAQQAGSLDSQSTDFPLNELALVDNTCRWWYGITPTAQAPGLCSIPPTPRPTPCKRPTQGCPIVEGLQYYWNADSCKCEPAACEEPEGGCGDGMVWVPDGCYCDFQ